MTPLQYYQQQLDDKLIEADEQQARIMADLQRIYDELTHDSNTSKTPFGNLLGSRGNAKAVKGLYIWGGVGVGKTFLMDLFFSCLPVKKMRLHFHQFMQRIHNELKTLQGHKDPLDAVAKKLVLEAKVICFDEFFVTDIADAMLLAGLLQGLFNNGICLISSSNLAPDELYKDGLQRERFLPAIELIKNNCSVFHVTSKHDYRLEHLQQAGVYFTPLGDEANQKMEKSFQHFSNHQPEVTGFIELLGRRIKIHKQAGQAIWFDFYAICDVPRSQKDYLALTKKYRTVLVSDIPIIKPEQNNLITAFINLVDVFYDAHVQLVISAATKPPDLYPDGQKQFAFQRTQSRLIEMQSLDYVRATSLPNH